MYTLNVSILLNYWLENNTLLVVLRQHFLKQPHILTYFPSEKLHFKVVPLLPDFFQVISTYL